MSNFMFTKAGREWNEDRCYVCNNFGFVLDGATTLVKQHLSSFNSDAEWVSSWWKEYLKESLPNVNIPLTKILKDGIKKSIKAFSKLAKGEKIEEFPSTTCSIVRRVNDKVEIFVLCNSPVIVKTKSGFTFTIIDENNNITDSVTMANYLETAKQENISLKECKEAHPEIVMAGRYKANNPHGYYVISNNVKAIDQAIYVTMDVKFLDKVLIMSDGYSQIFDLFDLATPNTLINKISELKDAETYYAKLYKLQEADSSLEKYPRFKLRDDASLVLMNF